MESTMRTVKKIVFENTVRNLRFRWGDGLSGYTDECVYALYSDFSESDDYGDNDAKFYEWFDMLPAYSGERVQVIG
jgi:hypothetical protein